MSHEVWAFLLATLCGFFAIALLGVRNAIDGGLAISIIADVIWWCVAFFMFVYCMWQTVAFEIRFFQLIGVGLGAILAHFTVERFITKFARFLLGLIFKILLTPWAFLYKILVVPILRIFSSNSRKVADNDSPERQDC